MWYPDDLDQPPICLHCRQEITRHAVGTTDGRHIHQACADTLVRKQHRLRRLAALSQLPVYLLVIVGIVFAADWTIFTFLLVIFLSGMYGYLFHEYWRLEWRNICSAARRVYLRWRR